MLLGQCIQDFTSSYGLPFSLFLAGLVGGVSHCAWMCSPFVVAQTNHQARQSFASKLLLPYHFGRMTTYVFLAIMVSSVINLVFVFSNLKLLISAPLLMTAGFIFIVSAFPKLLEIFPWVLKIKAGVPYKYIRGLISKTSHIKGMTGRYFLGILLGFMPCGLVVSALLASATAPSVFQSALAMGAFALGTIPALLMVSLGGYAFKYKYPKASIYVSRGGMVVSAIWLFTLAGTMIF
tara:strand:- start:2972 stop:3679 length:708 start_codon:yes stop_codon:yes gene_type:complete